MTLQHSGRCLHFARFGSHRCARIVDVVLHVATDGLSADARVAAVRVSGATGHTTVTMVDGSVR